MKLLKILFLGLVLTVAAATAFIWFGVYNIGADDPHWPVTYRLMETVRSRSITTRAADVQLPALNDPELIRQGAGNYNSMCVTCHLAPGSSDTELSLGLYPAPPTWSELGAVEPREAFWVIKHGVKMSGMPAWGKSMEDAYIWGMVAVLQQFPRMTAADYKALVAASPGHSHGGGETNVGVAAARGDHAGMSMQPRSSFEPADDPMADEPQSEPTHPDDGHPH